MKVEVFMMTEKTIITINEDVLKKTTKCKKNMSCLSKSRDLCEVELCVESKIHFIKCGNIEPCNYRVPFGYSYVCLCPVRKELYNKYNI